MITSVNFLTTGSGVATTQDYSIIDTHIEQDITFYPKVEIGGNFIQYMP